MFALGFVSKDWPVVAVIRFLLNLTHKVMESREATCSMVKYFRPLSKNISVKTDGLVSFKQETRWWSPGSPRCC